MYIFNACPYTVWLYIVKDYDRNPIESEIIAQGQGLFTGSYVFLGRDDIQMEVLYRQNINTGLGR